MPTYIAIEVTQEDIDKAEPKKSGRCVVARAIARTIPEARRIEVDVQSVRYSADGERHVFMTPYPVTGYIVAFDAGEEIEPFKFRLNEAHRIGVRRQVKTKAAIKVDTARTNKNRRAAKVKQLEAAAADPAQPSPDPAEITLARNRAAEAEAEHAAAVVTHADEPKSRDDTTHGTRKAPARSVWKTGRREYGGRLMAINGGNADKWTRPADEPGAQ